MKAIEEAEKSPAGVPEDENIDKIRDILFGVQVREFERNFSKLEEKFSKEVENMRNEMRGKLNKLEEFITREVNSLTDKVFKEEHVHSDAIKKLTGELHIVSNDLEEKISRLGEKAMKNESEMRVQILNQSKTLSDSIQLKQEEVFSALEREAKELRDDKADRAALADLFTEMAMRLAGEFRFPEPDYKSNNEDPSQ